MNKITVTPAAIAAAAEAMCNNGCTEPQVRADYMTNARIALAAALPLCEVNR